MGTFKNGPFKVPKLSEEHPFYGRLIAREAQSLALLPNFSEDQGLLILSDFGGEHKGASFTTYSILICSADKRSAFESKTKSLREKYGLNEPWKELGYKDLSYGPISRSLEEFLEIANQFIHGVLITVSIDQKIESVFGVKKKDAHNEITRLLQSNNLGEWKGKEAEKLLRVCHIIAVFMSILAKSKQKFLWLCDHDAINNDGKKRDFSHTQLILSHCLAMYSNNSYDIYGFAKPFEQDAGTSDLLSLADFAAGVTQEILQSELKLKKIEFSEEKSKIAKWMGTESNFLQKVNLVFLMQPDGEWGVGTVDIQAKI